MCTHHKKTISEVREMAVETERPMRWESAESIAQAFSTDVGNLLYEMTIVLWDWIERAASDQGEKIPKLNTVRREERQAKEKRFTESDLLILASELIGLGISPTLVAELEAIFTLFDPKFRDVFLEYYPQVWQNGLDRGYFMLQEHASRNDPNGLFATVPESYPLNQGSPLYIQYVNNGLQRITSNLTIQFSGLAMQTISQGLVSNGNWATIARQLYKKVGLGASWHWKRLVRTEMQIGFYGAMKERYGNAKVKYLKLVPVRTACPICRGAAGWYHYGNEVAVPLHPNCRCTYVPAWNLPRNTSIVA